MSLSCHLIADLSYPAGRSINDGISNELFYLKDVSMDNAVNIIVKNSGQGHNDGHKRCMQKSR